MIRMDMEKIIGLTGLLAAVIIGVMIVSYGGFVGNVVLIPVSTAGTSGQELAYDSAVCIYLNDELVMDCIQNTLTNYGKNMIKFKLTGVAASQAAVDYIAVGNGSLPTASSTSLNSEIPDCGLTRAQDTSKADIATGNWSYSYQFTSTCDGVIVNTTGLFNHTSADTGFFAGANFSSPVTLQTDDKLNITWYIFVTETQV